MGENPQIQMCKADTDIPKKTRSCNRCQRRFYKVLTQGADYRVNISSEITVLSILGYVCISFAHLDVGIFSHSFLQICSSSVSWKRSVDEHQSSNLSTDSQWDSSLGFGWATQGLSRSCSEAIPVLLWLYAWGHYLAKKFFFAKYVDQLFVTWRKNFFCQVC